MSARTTPVYEAMPLDPPPPLADDALITTAEEHVARLRSRRTVRKFRPDTVPEAAIRACIEAATLAPSGANHQPWHFVAVRDAAAKARIREAAEREEESFYAGGGGDEWLKALEPIGTGPEKPHLTTAPWLIVVFAQRWGDDGNGGRRKNYYINESVGIATGFLIQALHGCGLVSLTHTPNPMGFLNELLGRPVSEKPVMILATGHPAADATYPRAAAMRRPLDDTCTFV